MDYTRRELIAAGGQVGGALALAGMLAPLPAASAAPPREAAVVALRWANISKEEFVRTYTGLSGSPRDAAQLAGNIGAIVSYAPDAKEGLMLAEWSSLNGASDFANSDAARQTLRKAGVPEPSDVRVYRIQAV